jgi:hypothetical protein
LINDTVDRARTASLPLAAAEPVAQREAAPARREAVARA